MPFTACTLREIAALVSGTVEGGDPESVVSGVAGLDEARAGDLSFLANPRYTGQLSRTRATAVIVGPGEHEAPCALIRSKNPDLAFALAVDRMAPAGPELAPGRHPTAVIDPAARVAASARLGAHVVVEAGAQIGERCALWPGVYVGHGAALGADCCLMPGATIYHECRLGDRVILHSGAVIGSDGFGYAWDGRQHVKIRQVGTVEIGDDVEIGANTTIDRARFGTTRIGAGTKLDNLIQIAHNVELGPACAFAAMVGVAGSSRIGAGTLIGGQSAILGHVTIGPGTRLSGRTGVTKDLPGGRHYTGYPARPHEKQVDEWRHLKALGRLRADVKEMEQRLERLEAQAADGPSAG